MKKSIHDLVTQEVESLHAFFVSWFSGQCARECFERDFSRRFSPDLVFIPPAGRRLGLDNLSHSVYQAYASNPAFRIQIRNVRVEQVFGDYLIATYEEWQRNALASTPPDNGRIATVLFAVREHLVWEHIHETWLPPEQIAAGPYDF